MPQTIELADDLANVLMDEASRIGLSLSDDMVRLLGTAQAFAGLVRYGAEWVADWPAEVLPTPSPPAMAISETDVVARAAGR